MVPDVILLLVVAVANAWVLLIEIDRQGWGGRSRPTLSSGRQLAGTTSRTRPVRTSYT